MLTVVGCMLLGVLALALYHFAGRWVSFGAAYKAKLLCSGVFVAKRDADAVLDTDLAVDDLALLRHIDSRVDYASRTVMAGCCGLFKRRAVYRPGLGCVLAYDDPNQPLVIPPAPAVAIHSHGYATPAQMPLERGRTPVPLQTVIGAYFSEPQPQRPRRTRAVVVVHQGRVIAERYAPGFTDNTPLLGWSMAKSITNALAGILVREGRLSLHAPAPVPEWQTPDDKRGQITLDHLLHMSSGLRFGEDYRGPFTDVTRMLLGIPDMAAYAIDQPLAFEPGARWSYSSGATNIIARILRQTVGEADYHAFPRRALFEPIGMRSAVIETDASGTFVGSSFMYATARDWTRFGLLYLQDGMWSNERILPEGWVDYTRSPAPGDGGRCYGAHFWLQIPEEYGSADGNAVLPQDSFHAIGHEGQFLTIIPSRELVVVRLGLTRRPGAWDHCAFIAAVLDALDG